MGVYKLSAAGGVGTARTNYNSFLAGNPKFVGPSYESIATVTVGSGGQAEIEFASIPGTYKHLQIRAIGKMEGTNDFARDILLRFNSDTGSNYSRHVLEGDGSGAYASGAANSSSIPIGVTPDNYFGTSFFAPTICDILDYADTNKYKTIRSLGGYEVNNTTYNAVKFYSGNWRNTDAITNIKLIVSPDDFDQYSSFALYGIKGA